MQEVWGSVQGTETPSLRVFMATLRKKIEPDTSNPKYIQTHVGLDIACCGKQKKQIKRANHYHNNGRVRF